MIITPGTITSVGWLLDKIAQLKPYQFYKKNKLVKQVIKMRELYLQNSINTAHIDRLIFESEKEGLTVSLNRENRVLLVNGVEVSFEFLKMISDDTLLHTASFILIKDPQTNALKIIPSYTIVGVN